MSYIMNMSLSATIRTKYIWLWSPNDPSTTISAAMRSGSTKQWCTLVAAGCSSRCIRPEREKAHQRWATDAAGDASPNRSWTQRRSNTKLLSLWKFRWKSCMVCGSCRHQGKWHTFSSGSTHICQRIQFSNCFYYSLRYTVYFPKHRHFRQETGFPMCPWNPDIEPVRSIGWWNQRQTLNSIAVPTTTLFAKIAP